MRLANVINILGWIICGCVAFAPIAFPKPRQFARRYYVILLIMSVILEIVRISLAHLLPHEEWVMRPKDSPCKGFIPGLKFAYNGGMPSGHLAGTAFAFVLLYYAYPSVLTLFSLGVASIIIFLFRFLARCHTPFQLVIGWIIGFVVAVAFHQST